MRLSILLALLAPGLLAAPAPKAPAPKATAPKAPAAPPKAAAPAAPPKPKNALEEATLLRSKGSFWTRLHRLDPLAVYAQRADEEFKNAEAKALKFRNEAAAKFKAAFPQFSVDDPKPWHAILRNMKPAEIDRFNVLVDPLASANYELAWLYVNWASAKEGEERKAKNKQGNDLLQFIYHLKGGQAELVDDIPHFHIAKGLYFRFKASYMEVGTPDLSDEDKESKTRKGAYAEALTRFDKAMKAAPKEDSKLVDYYRMALYLKADTLVEAARAFTDSKNSDESSVAIDWYNQGIKALDEWITLGGVKGTPLETEGNLLKGRAEVAVARVTLKPEAAANKVEKIMSLAAQHEGSENGTLKTLAKIIVGEGAALLPDSKKPERLLYTEAVAAYDQKRFGDAIKPLEYLRKKCGEKAANPDLCRDGLYLLGMAYYRAGLPKAEEPVSPQKAGTLSKSAAALAEYAAKYKEDKRAGDAAFVAYQSLKQAYYFQAKGEGKTAENLQRMEEALAAFVKNFPAHPQAKEAQYDHGKVLLERAAALQADPQKAEQAAAAAEEGLKALDGVVPDSKNYLMARFTIAEHWFNRWDRIVKAPPDEPRAEPPEEIAKMAEAAEKDFKVVVALRAPSPEHRRNIGLALLRLAAIRMGSKDPSGAFSHLEKFESEYAGDFPDLAPRASVLKIDSLLSKQPPDLEALEPLLSSLKGKKVDPLHYQNANAKIYKALHALAEEIKDKEPGKAEAYDLRAVKALLEYIDSIGKEDVPTLIDIGDYLKRLGQYRLAAEKGYLRALKIMEGDKSFRDAVRDEVKRKLFICYANYPAAEFDTIKEEIKKFDEKKIFKGWTPESTTVAPPPLGDVQAYARMMWKVGDKDKALRFIQALNGILSGSGDRMFFENKLDLVKLRIEREELSQAAAIIRTTFQMHPKLGGTDLRRDFARTLRQIADKITDGTQQDLYRKSAKQMEEWKEQGPSPILPKPKDGKAPKPKPAPPPAPPK